MKALVKSKAEVGLWLEEKATPKFEDDELLIKIKKTAICGTDVHIYKWDKWSQATIKTPMIVGHEFAGIVAQVGNKVSGFKIGDRVSGEGHIVCGHCRNCRAGKRHLCRNTFGVGIHRPGSFAEYLALPASNAFKIPDSINDDIASIFDPYGNAVHTCLSNDLVGEDVLITGAGPIGIMAVAICRHVGARKIVITDVNQERLDLAQKMGADLCLNVKEGSLKDVMKKLSIVEGFDVGLEMSGNAKAFQEMIAVMNNGGKVAILGLLGNTAIDWDALIFKGLQLKGIYGREMYETWYKMVSMLESGLSIEKVITHKLPYQEFEKGFDLLLKGQAAKVVLSWD